MQVAHFQCRAVSTARFRGVGAGGGVAPLPATEFGLRQLEEVQGRQGMAAPGLSAPENRKATKGARRRRSFARALSQATLTTEKTDCQLAAWSSGMILASGARGPGLNSRSSPLERTRSRTKATPVGFEPTRGDPIGLAGRRLNRSAKVSLHNWPFAPKLRGRELNPGLPRDRRKY